MCKDIQNFDATQCSSYCTAKSGGITIDNIQKCLCCNERLRRDLGNSIESKSSNKALYEDSTKKYNQVKMETYNLGIGILTCSILSYYYIRKYTSA